MPIGDLLLPAIIFTVIGFIVGAMVSYLFVDRGSDREEKEVKPAEKPDAPPAAAAPAEKEPYKEPYTGLPMERFEPLARLYRENSTGKLVTEVEKKIYLNPDMLSPEHLEKLREAAENWNAWLGLQVPVVPDTPVETLPRPEIPTATLPFIPEVTAANGKPRATSVVGQIDEILQEMLRESPLASHGLRLVQDPSMAVVVWVDAQKYEGIDSVPDEEIKNLIRAAVKKWEETSRF